MKDLEEHETKHCEYRLIHCHECDEKMSVKKYSKHACLLRKEVDQMKVLLFDIRNQVTKGSNYTIPRQSNHNLLKPMPTAQPT